MKNKYYSSSTSSSDDDELLIVKKRKSHDENHSSDDEPLIEKKLKNNDKNNLFSYSVQQCDFCDRVFHNKYNILVHNSQHIIIPLLKQQILRCTSCSIYCTSQEELDHHKATQHPKVPDLLESIIKKQPVVKCFNLSELLKTKNVDNVEETPVLEKDVKESIEVKNDLVEETPFYENDTRITEMQANLENIVNVQPVIKCDNSVTELINSNIRSRIIFEDDIEEDDIISLNPMLVDLTTDCKVDLETIEVFNGLESNVSDNDKNVDLCNGKIILGSKVANFQPSVPYDDLMVPGHYVCNKCYETFPNRYKLIIHETTHIEIKRGRPILCSVCDLYISGSYKNLHQHVSKYHPHSSERLRSNRTLCNMCGLKYYNYYRHAQNYHYVCQCKCGEGFLNQKILEKHVRICNLEPKVNRSEHRDETNHILPHAYQEANDNVVKVKTHFKIIKLCELCSMFKQKSFAARLFNFVCVGELCEVGTRQTCEGCSKEFFNINVIKQIPKKEYQSRSEYKRHNSSSNEDRLKQMRRKLKYLNKLTRL